MQAKQAHKTPNGRMANPFGPALSVLLGASQYAAYTHVDPWEFAVEIGQLRALGLTDNDLRFLVRLRYVDHATEVTPINKDGRQFRRTGDLSFTERTCFVLAPEGIVAVRGGGGSAMQRPVLGLRVLRIPPDQVLGQEQVVPSWDAQRRVLYFIDKLVKQFKWYSANQEKILSAFEEEGWPTRIDDPLPPAPCLDVKRRLSDTIKCLNRKQTNELIHFRGDGTGRGVIWESRGPVAGELPIGASAGSEVCGKRR
jgi:hypothetical protein